MCGIIGHLALSPQCPLSRDELLRLNDLMKHRGPDSAGSFQDGPLSLAMRRLAIIDANGGNQPITTPDGRYTIVFNGEIYNYKEIRKDLTVKGYRLNTQSDTEVLLFAFMHAGPACLDELNGMFAFAIWDRDERRLFLARDRLGVKPLYYKQDSRHFMFASEITPIHACGLFDLRIDLRAVADLLAYWYICEPKTIFRDVFQVPPGHYLVVREDGSMRMTRWWQVPANTERPIGFQEAKEELTALLRDSVRLRLRSDVPIGILLSGGIDSGLVTSFARGLVPQIKCVSIGFKEKSYSEIDLATQTAKRLSTELVTSTMAEIRSDLLERILSSIDEPLGNASLIPSYFLFKLASEHATVILTGDGGDELFGGYPTYQAPYFRRIFRWLPNTLQNAAAVAAHRIPVSHARISLDYRLKQFVDGVRLPQERAHASWREVLNIAAQKSLFRPSVAAELGDYDPFVNFAEPFTDAQRLGEMNRFMYADIHTYLRNDHLRKIDRMSMVHSVEARGPLLDYRVVEFAMRLPAEHKVSFRQTKRILREIGRPLLPAFVISGTKKGLTPPIASWIANDMTTYVKDQLMGELLAQLFQPAAIARLLSEHLARRVDNSRLIWALLSLQVWARHARVRA
jgi:asparagine synthase (glutamine-hydrolysing)